jgi:hypothetical protein
MSKEETTCAPLLRFNPEEKFYTNWEGFGRTEPGVCRPCAEGEYVLYADYRRLEEENRALKKKTCTLQSQFMRAIIQRDETREELNALKATTTRTSAASEDAAMSLDAIAEQFVENECLECIGRARVYVYLRAICRIALAQKVDVCG